MERQERIRHTPEPQTEGIPVAFAPKPMTGCGHRRPASRPRMCSLFSSEAKGAISHNIPYVRMDYKSKSLKSKQHKGLGMHFAPRSWAEVFPTTTRAPFEGGDRAPGGDGQPPRRDSSPADNRLSKHN